MGPAGGVQELERFRMGTLFSRPAAVAELFVTGQPSGLLAHRSSQRMIESFTDHIIVCGFGRIGRQASHALLTAASQRVAFDVTPASREMAESMRCPGAGASS